MAGLASIALAASMSSSVSFGGRPPVRPARRAGAKHAWVRSRIRLRSNSASAPTCEKPAPLRRRREGFGQAAKPDTPHPRGFDGFDQLLHRPREAIELPHDQRVAAAREFERVMLARAVCNRTRHLLGENLCAPCFGQSIALQGKVLVYGRHAGIADQHRFRRDVAGIG
jgi:hypothetical protein